MLRKITLVLAIAGIAFLLATMAFLPPRNITIEELSSLKRETRIQITGEVTKIQHHTTGDVLTITDKTGSITTFVERPHLLSPNETIMLRGTIEKYRGTTQIRAERIYRPARR